MSQKTFKLFGSIEIPISEQVVHVSSNRHTVYIGRPSEWGNPFIIGKDGTRIEVIEKYHDWLLEQPELLKKLPELSGQLLGCYCHPKPCHGDVLQYLLNSKIYRLTET